MRKKAKIHKMNLKIQNLKDFEEKEVERNTVPSRFWQHELIFMLPKRGVAKIGIFFFENDLLSNIAENTFIDPLP